MSGSRSTHWLVIRVHHLHVHVGTPMTITLLMLMLRLLSPWLLRYKLVMVVVLMKLAVMGILLLK